MKPKLLTIDELPEHARASFDLGSQRIEKNTRTGVCKLYITRTCTECWTAKGLPVAAVRHAARNGKLTTNCIKCGWKRGPHKRPLTADELPPTAAAAYDLSSQRMGDTGRRNMRITYTCVKCGAAKEVYVGNVRQAAKKGTLSGRCPKCTVNGKNRQWEMPAGPQHCMWKGGRFTDKKGNVYVKSAPRSKTYVLEHRLVMEQHLGRKLGKSERVRHLNGIRSDNRIENLALPARKSEWENLW